MHKKGEKTKGKTDINISLQSRRKKKKKGHYSRNPIILIPQLNTQNLKKRKIDKPVISFDEKENNDDACIFCNELYINSMYKEGWIQCSSCERLGT